MWDTNVTNIKFGGISKNIKANFWTKDNSPVWKMRVFSGNPSILRIPQTASGKSLQKRNGSAVGPCFSRVAQAVPENCGTDDGSHKRERSAAFKMRANNLESTARPSYSENVLKTPSFTNRTWKGIMAERTVPRSSISIEHLLRLWKACNAHSV